MSHTSRSHQEAFLKTETVEGTDMISLIKTFTRIRELNVKLNKS